MPGPHVLCFFTPCAVADFPVWAGPSLDTLHLVMDAVAVPTTTASTTLLYSIPGGQLLSEGDEQRSVLVLALVLSLYIFV